MALNFAPIPDLDGGLFGVRISGTPSRLLKKRLRQLWERCLDSGKTRVLLDVEGLSAIGGGAGAVLAAFQRDLLEHDGGLLFVGVGETDRRMLEQRFEELPLQNYPSITDAQNGVSATVATTENSLDTPADEPPSATVEDLEAAEAEMVGAVAVAPDDDLEADKYLDDILFGFESAEEDIADVAAAETDEVADAIDDAAEIDDEVELVAEAEIDDEADDAAGTSDPAGRENPVEFMELDDALAAIRRAPTPESLHFPLCSLLHAHDLAASSLFCLREGDYLVEIGGESRLGLGGGVEEALAEAKRPLCLLDVPDDELDDEQADFLADARPDLIVPIVWDGDLAGAVFLQHGKDDPEYGVSETFALEMLMQQLGRNGTADNAPAGAAGDTVAGDMKLELMKELRKAQIMFALNDELSRAVDERAFWEQLMAVLADEIDIRTLVFLEGGSGIPDRRYCLGQVDDDLLEMDLTTVQYQAYFESLEQSVAIDDLPSALTPLRTMLDATGMTCIASLRDRKEWLGTLLLGISDQSPSSVVDNDFLNTIFQQTFTSLRALRAHAANEARGLDLVRLVVLTGETQRYGSAQFTERLTHYVRLLLREVGFSEAQERDIVLGALLRDVGLLELDWPATLSQQSLDDKQWKVFRRHPQDGKRLLSALNLPSIVQEVVASHHEQFNGEGFPAGLAGRDIPLAARLVAVVEHYVIMISNLPNSPALSPRQSVGVLRENVGEAFDPDIVDIFLRVLELEAHSPAEAAENAPDVLTEVLASV